MGYITVDRINHSFAAGPGDNTVLALRDVNFEIERGEFVTLLGPSGCGKTTLLRIMHGLIKPTEGHVVVDGKPVQGPDPRRAMVFQDFGLLPWRTALHNIEMWLEFSGVKKPQRRRKAEEMIKVVGLEGFEKLYPHQLSGGMKQRVGLARALSMSPDSFFMDEPFASLDAQMRELMQEELLRIWSQFKTTVVFVTHGIDEAIYLSDRVIVMSARPGRVKLEMPIPFPRPRHGVRAAPEFARLREELWEILKGEIQYGRMRGTSDGG
ncbi:MAG TPA: ABC transporter ATP-binding protein [Dehalococcoidia bacterium]|nr:ABC transporter ATP-binding protein [Dehalococcoidia bacterium]